MRLNNQIYLDYNATTPVLEEVVDYMVPYFSHQFANPSSNHIPGWLVEEDMQLAKKMVSQTIEAKEEEIVFFSGATEAINVGIIGYALKNAHRGKHIITCKTEHKAVLESCLYLETLGFSISYLDVNQNGEISYESLHEAINENTIMIALMLANNETGVIHPIEEWITSLSHFSQIVWFVDATQAIGKIPFSVKKCQADMIVFSGHKLYGPKGVGVLYKKANKNIQLSPLSYGGYTEFGLRAGTYNVPAIMGIAKALQMSHAILNEEKLRIHHLMSYFEKAILDIGDAQINGYETLRLPNTSNITFGGIDYTHFLQKLKPLALSQGSACNALQTKASHVLLAMGLNNEKAFSSVRVSMGRFTTQEDIDMAIQVFKDTIPKLRK
jgi:cysteine desulfurase